MCFHGFEPLTIRGDESGTTAEEAPRSPQPGARYDIRLTIDPPCARITWLLAPDVGATGIAAITDSKDGLSAAVDGPLSIEARGSSAALSHLLIVWGDTWVGAPARLPAGGGSFDVNVSAERLVAVPVGGRPHNQVRVRLRSEHVFGWLEFDLWSKPRHGAVTVLLPRGSWSISPPTEGSDGIVEVSGGEPWE